MADETKRPDGAGPPAGGPPAAPVEPEPEPQPLASRRRGPAAADYRVLVHRDGAKGSFVARAPELEHCEVEAPTRAEAVARLEEEIEATVANIRGAGREPPPPVDDIGAFSGEIALRVPRGLHRDLVWQARHEGVTVEHLATDFLARGVEARHNGRRAARSDDRGGDRGGEPRGDRDRGRGPGGARYHGIMDDRAHFIEYVRGLEHGVRGGGGGGGGGGGRHRGGRGR